MATDRPKSLSSPSQTPNCSNLERQNLICELEKASCSKQLLEHIPVLIEAKEALQKQKVVNAVLTHILVELITGWLEIILNCDIELLFSSSKHYDRFDFRKN